MQKRPIILRSLLIVATPYADWHRARRTGARGGRNGKKRGRVTERPGDRETER